MREYERFKKWEPSKGDYINYDQKNSSRKEKAKRRRNKIVIYSLGLILLVIATILLV